MAKAQWYSVMAAPTIIVADGDAALHSWRGSVPAVDEVLKILEALEIRLNLVRYTYCGSFK